MFEIVCVTSRRLCCEGFAARLVRLAQAGVTRIILREKDLTQQQYAALAARTEAALQGSGALLVLHGFADAALQAGAQALHLPLAALEARPQLRAQFATLGVSVHSLQEARRAAALGVDYLIAGHVFATDCKRGAPARGVEFLSEICRSVSVPVYGIGGITPANIARVRDAGASGACQMSSLMMCADASAYLEQLRAVLRGK
nr:thiamine phosphate synthase [Maliibacterium massiliense]